MLGGLGVGAALIIAPMYIAEMAPPESRGRLVSFNQLNIVIGISVAFFSNYLILTLGESGAAWTEALRLGEWNWRWMLGVETLPAVLYLFALLFVPESPRWLAMRGRDDEAREVLERVGGSEQAADDLRAVKEAIVAEAALGRVSPGTLLHPSLRLVMTIGISVGILQQITGINAVFFYAPMIFEQSGIGTNASFMQAVLVGLVNLVLTVVAMALIDRLGRRPLLGFGLTGIAVCMLTLAWGFGSATYRLDQSAIDALPAGIEREQAFCHHRRGQLQAIRNRTRQQRHHHESAADPSCDPGFRRKLRGFDRAHHVGAVLGAVSEPGARCRNIVRRPDQFDRRVSGYVHLPLAAGNTGQCGDVPDLRPVCRGRPRLRHADPPGDQGTVPRGAGNNTRQGLI
jgi:hypothetical protein